MDEREELVKAVEDAKDSYYDAWDAKDTRAVDDAGML